MNVKMVCAKQNLIIDSPWPVVDTAPILSSAYPPHPAITTVHIITRVGTLIVATIYLQMIQNRFMF